MSNCTLTIGGILIMRSDGAPDAEYLLFDPSDIELKSTAPGSVREHSYNTTAGKARERLASLGYTLDAARACAEAMQPKLVAAYARGHAAERLAAKLSVREVLEGFEYKADAHEYTSMYIDIAGLAADLGLPNAPTSLQCVHLACFLGELPEEAEVELTTIAYMANRRQGERSHKRPNVDNPDELLAKLKELSQTPAVSRAVPVSQSELVEMLEARAASGGSDSAKARFMELAQAAATAKAPAKGPLADPALWAIEMALNEGATAGVLEQLDTIERKQGRVPGTAYLRARLQLALGSEPAQRIAEKVSALALSMTSFTQLELLAAEAWSAAGDLRRALPYARDLVESGHIDDETRGRARAIMAIAKRQSIQVSVPDGAPAPASTVPHEPEKPATKLPVPPSVAAPPPPPLPPPPPPPKKDAGRPPLPPPAPPPHSAASQSTAPQPAQQSTAPQPAQQSTAPQPAHQSSAPQPAQQSTAPQPARSATSPSSPPQSTAPRAGASPSAPPPPQAATPSMPPPPPLPSVAPALRRTSPPAPPDFDDFASLRDVPAPPPSPLPPPDQGPPPIASRPPPALSEAAPPPPRRSSTTRRGGLVEQRHSTLPDPRAEPDDEPVTPAIPSRLPPDVAPQIERPEPAPAPRPSAPPPPMQQGGGSGSSASSRPSAMPAKSSRGSMRPSAEYPLMRGASQPPFAAEDPPPTFPKAPLMPKFDHGAQLAHDLSLPPGVSPTGNVALEPLPQSVLEARIRFTMLSRALGQRYRDRGVDLRLDVAGIEAMQTYLFETFPSRAIRTAEEARLVHEHGAFLSEILARVLDAEWVDIGAPDIGHWAMVVPPATRVWPFGRVMRLIAMGQKERDLVSYYLELANRKNKG